MAALGKEHGGMGGWRWGENGKVRTCFVQIRRGLLSLNG